MLYFASKYKAYLDLGSWLVSWLAIMTLGFTELELDKQQHELETRKIALQTCKFEGKADNVTRP